MATPWRLYWPWPLHTTAGQRRALLRLLAVAAEERIAPAPLLRAWADCERGLQVGRLWRVATRLERGDPLADAVARVPGVLSDEDTLSVRFGAQSGSLASAIRHRLDQQLTEESPRLWGELRKTFLYCLLFFFNGLFVLTFIVINFQPEMLKLESEFEFANRSKEWGTFTFNRFLIDYYFVGISMVLILVLSRWSRGLRRWLRWSLTIPLGSPQGRATAGVMQHLSTAATMGRPVAGALSTLARYHYDPVLRGRLLFARNELEQGAELWPTLRQARMISPAQAKVLHLADRLGNRAWALRALSRSRSIKTTRRFEAVAACLTPLILLAAGWVVYLNSTFMFGWMSNLLQTLALPAQNFPR